MYDHNKKAGNQGDVVKHPALIAAVDSIIQDSQAECFNFFDTFAGYAYNPLLKGNEWVNGINHIHRFGRSSENPHVKSWMSMWQLGTELTGNVYPGSSLFTLKTCQNRGIPFRGTLFDISPAVVSQLMTVFADLDTQVLTRTATIRDIKCGPSADLLFIDPPGIRSEKNRHYPAVSALTAFVEGKHNVLVWLPMVTDLSNNPIQEHSNSSNWRQAFVNAGLAATTVRWGLGGPVCGCQLFYRLPPIAVAAVRSAIVATLSLTDWTTKDVMHFEPKQQVIDTTDEV